MTIRSEGQPVGQLGPQDWMAAPETQAVVAALAAKGALVRFVGGCVRDAVLKRPIRDIDIATHDPPETVIALLAAAGIHAIPTGIKHGTITAVIGKAHFEVTTLREDVETFGRHARVAFTDDWTADAARRDFTMNAMFADIQGHIFDPFNGLADLGAGRVCFVGDAATRIEEDVLRLLRFFRFHAHYGRPPMDRSALAACRRLAPKLATLSGERVAGEFIRLLQAPDPAGVMVEMHAQGVLAHVLPEAKRFGALRVLTWLETRAMVRETVHPDPIRRLGIVLETDGPGARTVAERLKLSNHQRDRMTAVAAPPAAITSDLKGWEQRRLLRRLGADEFRDLVLSAWAVERAKGGTGGAEDSRRWMDLLDEADSWVPVELPVKGRDLMALGIPAGPEIGRLMAEIEAWWEAQDYRPGREETLERLRFLAG